MVKKDRITVLTTIISVMRANPNRQDCTVGQYEKLPLVLESGKNYKTRDQHFLKGQR